MPSLVLVVVGHNLGQIIGSVALMLYVYISVCLYHVLLHHLRMSYVVSLNVNKVMFYSHLGLSTNKQVSSEEEIRCVFDEI